MNNWGNIQRIAEIASLVWETARRARENKMPLATIVSRNVEKVLWHKLLLGFLDKILPIEAIKIENIEVQTKYRYNNSDWDWRMPSHELLKMLKESWFTQMPRTFHNDTFFVSNNNAWAEWKAFRVRHSSKTWDVPHVTYKYSQKSDKGRKESILSFPIEEDDIDLIKAYYNEVGSIFKFRTKFVKGNVIITFDSEVIIRKSWWKMENIWNFIEILWCKDEEELAIYKELIEKQIGQESIQESYYDMLLAA